jgi:hypothetical protein
MRPSRVLARCAVLLAVVAGPLAGCADSADPGAPSDPPAPGSSSPADPADPSAAARTDPEALVGTWTVDGGGVEDGATLELDAGGELRIKQACTLIGSWRADAEGLLVADVSGATDCPAADPVPPRWLTGVGGYRIEANPVLLDARGAEVVRLVPGGAADPPKTKPPTRPDERSRPGPAAPLPAGLTPATRETMAGRWVPAGDTKSQPRPAFAQFLPGGEWLGSDGCNGQRGRWTLGEAGAFLATAGPSTLMACDNVAIAGWLSDARRAGLDGAELVLVDGAGKELGRLRRGA